MRAKGKRLSNGSESVSKMAVEKKKEMKALVAESSPTLCDGMDCSPPDLCPWNSPGKKTGVIDEWVKDWLNVPFSRESSQPQDQTSVSCIAGSFFTV